MDIKIINRSESKVEEYDYRNAIEFQEDGLTVLSFKDDEPEDSNLSRSFKDVYKIEQLLKDVYEAGVKGEELNFETVESDEI